MFAKLYETKIGQILIKLDTDNDECKPEVRFYCKPEGLGVCSTALIFNDDDDGWEKAEFAFNDIDETKALGIINNTMKDVSEIIPQTVGNND